MNNDLDEKDDVQNNIVDTDEVNSDGTEDFIEHISQDDSYIDGANVTYTSVQVAEILSKQLPGEKKLSSDMVRYWAREFLDFLDVEKTSSGEKARWLFHAKDVEKLKVIIPLRRDQGKSVEEIKQILQDDTTYGIYLHNDKFMHLLVKVLERNNQVLESSFKKTIDTLLLEQEAESKKLIESSELREQGYQNTIAELQKQVASLQQLVEERLPKKPEKKGLFSRFRK